MRDKSTYRSARRETAKAVAKAEGIKLREFWKHYTLKGDKKYV